MASIRTEDRCLIAVAVQDQRVPQPPHRGRRGAVAGLGGGEEAVGGSLVADQGGHEPAAGMRRDPGVPAGPGGDGPGAEVDHVRALPVVAPFTPRWRGPQGPPVGAERQTAVGGAVAHDRNPVRSPLPQPLRCRHDQQCLFRMPRRSWRQLHAIPPDGAPVPLHLSPHRPELPQLLPAAVPDTDRWPLGVPTGNQRHPRMTHQPLHRTPVADQRSCHNLEISHTGTVASGTDSWTRAIPASLGVGHAGASASRSAAGADRRSGSSARGQTQALVLCGGPPCPRPPPSAASGLGLVPAGVRSRVTSGAHGRRQTAVEMLQKRHRCRPKTPWPAAMAL